MKNWTLESPGAGLVLHLVFFALVLATVHYSERRASAARAPATAGAFTSGPAMLGTTAPGRASPARALPVAGTAAQHHPNP